MLDFSIDTNNIIVERDIDSILQQIDILFDTNVNDIFGEPYYGANFNRFLWDLTVSNSQIEDYTRTLIYNNINLFDYNLDVQCIICKGTMNDIIIIRINLSIDDISREKIYRIG